MKFIKNTITFIVALLTIPLHQACIDNLDIQINGSDTYIIDAMFVNPDSIHFVKISLANETPIDSLTKFSVRLTDDNGEVTTFIDSEEFLANYPPLTDYYNYREYEYELNSIFNTMNNQTLEHDGNGYWKNPVDIIINNSKDRLSKIFIVFDCKLEIGRKYTLTVTIDDKEYSATEKLLPPIEITGMKYEKTERFKSIGEGSHTWLIPVFSLVNNSEESKYFLASLGELNSLYIGSIRIFSTENMSDTISKLQLSEFNYEPAYSGSTSNVDDWYIDKTIGVRPCCYCFYPISRANYNYYKIIEKQIRTDGGLYSPAAATPVTNFSGGNVYGQFIVTSESYILQ